MSTHTDTTTLDRVLASRARALTWLEAHVDERGAATYGTAAMAARGPLAFAYAGRYDLAGAQLEWLAGLPREELRFSPDGRYGSYPLLLLAQGAVQANRPDLGRALHADVVDWLAPCGMPWSRSADGCGETEIVPSAQAGITLLALGDMERARRVGDGLCAAWEAQPEPDERFFIVTDGDGALITELPEGIDEDERRHRVVERDGERQHFFTGGIIAAFLVQLHWATGEARYLEVARATQDFAMGQPHQFSTLQVCKTAWGSAYLAVATREAVHRDWTLRMGDWFADGQAADGSWRDHHSPYGSDGEYSVTAEFLQHLTFVAWALGQRS